MPKVKAAKQHSLKKHTLVGLPIKDAVRSIRLEITPADITSGRRKDNGHCAAANACLRQLRAKDVKIHVARVFIRSNGHWIRYKTPRSLRTEIVAFDRGGTFEPSIHMLTPPPKDKQRSGVGTRQGDRGKAAKRRTVHIVAGIRPHA